MLAPKVLAPRLVERDDYLQAATRQCCGMDYSSSFSSRVPLLTRCRRPFSLFLPHLSLSLSQPLLSSLSGPGGNGNNNNNNNDDDNNNNKNKNSSSPTTEEASTSSSASAASAAASPSPQRRRLFGRGGSPSHRSSRSPSPSPTTIAASNPSTKLAARAAAASSPSSSPSKYAPLTLDQAAAIDENAEAITRRVDAKAGEVRRDAAARLVLYLALAAAALRVSPIFGAVVGAFLGLWYGQFLRGSVVKQWATRRRTHDTVARARAALAAAALGCERAAAARSRFDGTWYRDAAASDSMERALDVMAIRGILRKAIALVKGLVLKVGVGGSGSNSSSGGGLFTLQVFSVIPILKITERYPLTGAPVEHRRRDLRAGKAAGSTQLLADGRLRTTLVWEGCKPGSGTDTFEVSEDGGTLTVSSFLKVEGQTASYRVVYRKAT